MPQATVPICLVDFDLDGSGPFALVVLFLFLVRTPSAPPPRGIASTSASPARRSRLSTSWDLVAMAARGPAAARGINNRFAQFKLVLLELDSFALRQGPV
ncbi:hypothetical protein CDD80_6574 [Ophiocordyceps camponoti-rufipedis]|uniref:Uncharacterized protein n=1 Tax=Ophiocordyceps camponoti-rufipedis TaxID=2004952 RepID=A0A2C5YQR3_9HYPO|nr:hypothetical protein CDD80_6574 [Ophiocordyceps camponoti-rufipedis]